MLKTVCLPMIIICCTSLSAQTRSTREAAAKTVFEGRPATLRLAPHRTTTIRLPDPVNSVVVGDPTLFHAKYSPDEPLLVFAKPISSAASESNLIISTMQKRQFVFVLKSLASAPADETAVADLLVNCRPAEIFFIEDTFPSLLISETLDLANTAVPGMATGNGESDRASGDSILDDMVRRQRQKSLRNPSEKDVQVGIGQVLEDGSRLIVSFSV